MKSIAVPLAVSLLLGTTVLASTDRPSARKLVARLTDGNEQVPANNRIVERLVAKGEKAFAPLRQALEDEDFEGRGYAAWALAKVLVETGKRPPEMIAELHEAVANGSAYVRALAISGLRLLGVRAVPEKGAPNPWIVAVLRDAPGPEATPEKLVAALPERGGYWPEVIADRLMLKGEQSLPTLRRAAADETFEARDVAKRTLDRLTAALAAGTSTPEQLILGFESGTSARLEVNNALVDRLLLHGKAAIPALTTEIARPGGAARGYAWWAIAKVLRATGARPEKVMKFIKARYDPLDSPRIILGE